MSTAEKTKTSTGSFDPVTFEVLRNGFRAACSEGSAMLERVAYHPVITEAHDSSVSLLTADVHSFVQKTTPLVHQETTNANMRTAL